MWRALLVTAPGALGRAAPSSASSCRLALSAITKGSLQCLPIAAGWLEPPHFRSFVTRPRHPEAGRVQQSSQSGQGWREDDTPGESEELTNIRIGELLQRIEQSREENNPNQEVKLSLELYSLLKSRGSPDSDVFQVAFGIARIYDEQLEDFTTATAYYLESLEVLKAIAVDSAAWDACMHVTTLGALAICFEKTEQPKKAEQYFEQAIAAYEAHCGQSAASADPESDDEEDEEENEDGEEEDEEVVEYEGVSESEIAFLSDLNSAAAMLFYRYGANLLDQERWEEARDAMEHALTLAENSSMAPEELDDLQQSVHDIWLEMETE